MRAERGLAVDERQQAHVLEEGGLGERDADDGAGVAEGELADEADGEADGEVVPVPLLVLPEAFRHGEMK